MGDIELFQRLALAIAIGAVVGVERHWRERDIPLGQRTAGIRTFALMGLFGGIAALIERELASDGRPAGIVLATFFAVLTSAVTLLRYRETAERGGVFSVTSVVAVMLTYALGAVAVLGNVQIASSGGVVLLTVLASREFFHKAMRKLRWAELRSAVILLALTFVLLPILPSEPIGPYGGISPARTLMLVILLASISFGGYIAVRMLGSARGEVAAGAVGGIVAATAVAVNNARRSKLEDADTALAAGAIASSAVALVRTGVLVATLAPVIVPLLIPALGGAALVMAAYAALLARKGEQDHAGKAPKNPFELDSVIKMALLLVAITFFAKAASQMFGDAGLFIVSALSGLADVDAATVTVTGMMDRLSPATGAEAIGLAMLTNMIAKAVYGSLLGSRRFSLHVWIASLAATAVAATLYFAMA
ncbi:Uncharacterized membrane protein, DUF4010 family [Sphingomonas laterariae]|uniref:Uncharacterized membrane protein, DUF4010 family n=1 Tax=Edaphosphingomonas laterariae TaxID=861865 RepID=A0A239JUD7_9SPHN|nr:DUF4010 domain-containing protein [Sphingomonas laterariae]SNT09152.1 Uncharacterized membrane protein, DUF4010 family [Sphingomonas laterariae]